MYLTVKLDNISAHGESGYSLFVFRKCNPFEHFLMADFLFSQPPIITQ